MDRFVTERPTAINRCVAHRYGFQMRNVLRRMLLFAAVASLLTWLASTRYSFQLNLSDGALALLDGRIVYVPRPSNPPGVWVTREENQRLLSYLRFGPAQLRVFPFPLYTLPVSLAFAWYLLRERRTGTRGSRSLHICDACGAEFLGFTAGICPECECRAIALALSQVALRSCPNCGYDTRGNPTNICPECGTDAAGLKSANRRRT
jgi:hypothetical protein